MLPKPKDAFRLVHISDVHCRVFPKNLFYCFNKRFKSFLRQVFCSVDFQDVTICNRFPDLIRSLHTNSVCLTGDLTLTALHAEFSLARHFIDHLAQYAKIHLVPGNHDVYTKTSYQEQTFYHYFPNVRLQKNKVAKYRLTPDWWIILLDCSCLNGWFSANGKVFLSQIAALESLLSSIPQSENIIIANHYPLLTSKKKFHTLLNNSLLQETLRDFPNIRLYLHGHDHQATLYANKDLSPGLILNSGSISLPSNARFYIIDLYPQDYQVHTAVLTNLMNYEEPLNIKIETTWKAQNLNAKKEGL